jgi:DNA topoisomerase-3
MPEDAERKGLGTPATRAAIIEKLVKTGFVVRSKKNLLPTDNGKNLIAVLPETLISAKLTAEWEHKLMQVQRGEMAGAVFMDGIASFISMIVKDNNAPKPEFTGLFAETSNKKAGKSKKSLGNCPRCGAPVREAAQGFFCDTGSCGFKLWKNSRFWTAKKKPLTADIVTALLKDGKIILKGLYSEKTGKSYDAAVSFDDSGGQFINYKLHFDN